MDNQLKWYQKPMIIADFIPPEPERFEKTDVKVEYEIRRALGFNAEHVEVHDISEGESATTFYPSEYAVHQRKDILGEILRVYEKEKLHVITYFNVHWMAESLAQSHPDWAQRCSDGSMLKSGYGLGGYFCVNSGFREYAFGTLRTLGKHAISGVFLDGPFMYENGCYCEACRAKFRSEFGYEAPAQVCMGTPEWEDWFLFKRRCIAQFLQDARKQLKSVNPDAIIYMNSHQLTSTVLCSRDNRMTEPHQDLLLAEGGFFYGNLRETPIWKPAATAMLLECQSNGKPYCVAIAGRLGPWSRYLLPSTEMVIAHAMAIAHGAWTWYGIYNDNNKDPSLVALTEFNTFVQNNAQYYTQTNSVAKIALLWSAITANHTVTSSEKTDFTERKDQSEQIKKNDHKQAFDGWFEVMSRSRELFDVIDDTALENGQLDRYNVLILPGVACIGDAAAKKIVQFVKNGGSIISTCDSGSCNEYGKLRKNNILAGVYGLEEMDGIFYHNFDHITMPDTKTGPFANVAQSQLPAAHIEMRCTPKKDVQCYGEYRKTQKSRYCELPPVTNYPYIVENTFGKGKSLYYAGNVDTFYNQYALDEYRQMLCNGIHMMCESQAEIQFPQPVHSIHISIRTQIDRIIVHIINYTGTMVRPMNTVFALSGGKLYLKNELAAQIDDGKQAHALKADAVLPIKSENSAFFVELPDLKEYEVIVFPLSK